MSQVHFDWFRYVVYFCSLYWFIIAYHFVLTILLIGIDIVYRNLSISFFPKIILRIDSIIPIHRILLKRHCEFKSRRKGAIQEKRGNLWPSAKNERNEHGNSSKWSSWQPNQPSLKTNWSIRLKIKRKEKRTATFLCWMIFLSLFHFFGFLEKNCLYCSACFYTLVY